MQSPSSCCIFAAESQLWTGKNGEDFDLRRLGADGWTARAVRLDASGRLTRRPGAFFFSTRLHLPPDPVPSPSGPSFISFWTLLHLPPNPASSPSEPSFISFWTQLPIPLDPASSPFGPDFLSHRHTSGILQAYSKHTQTSCLGMPTPCHLLAKCLPSPCESNKKNGFCPLIAEPEKMFHTLSGKRTPPIDLPYTSLTPPLDLPWTSERENGIRRGAKRLHKLDSLIRFGQSFLHIPLPSRIKNVTLPTHTSNLI